MIMLTKKSLANRTVLLSGIMVGVVLGPPAFAGKAPSTEQLLKMIESQQSQLNALKHALAEAESQARDAATKAEEASQSAPGLPKGFQLGGAIEIEATSAESYAGTDSSDLTLAKVEAFFDAKPFEYVSTHLQVIYEDDGNENVNLDEAFVTLGDAEKYPFYLQTGKWAVPFGGFDTAMSTDPLTKNLGETKEAAVLVGYTNGDFTAEGYGYNGDTQKTGEGDNIDQFGISAGYAAEMNGTLISIGGGYLSNIADSDTLTSTLGGTATALNKYIAGWEAHASVGNGPFTVYAGYMTAAKSFQSGEVAFNGRGAKPKAWNLEAAYVTDVSGKETTLAATIQGTDEALALSLPDQRYGGAITVQVFDHAAVTAEYLRDKDYGTGVGGTGNSGHTATLKLAADF